MCVTKEHVVLASGFSTLADCGHTNGLPPCAL